MAKPKHRRVAELTVAICVLLATSLALADEPPENWRAANAARHWLWSTATILHTLHDSKDITACSIGEGLDGRLLIGGSTRRGEAFGFLRIEFLPRTRNWIGVLNDALKNKAVEQADAQKLESLIANIDPNRRVQCRAMTVADNGTVWAGVVVSSKAEDNWLHVVSYRPGDAAPTDHGAIAISNLDTAAFDVTSREPSTRSNAVDQLDDGTLIPRGSLMAINAHSNGNVYVLTLNPLTLHELRFPKVAGVVTEYRHNSHADVFLTRMLQSDTFDGLGAWPQMKLASLFTDQVPKTDTSRGHSEKYRFPIYPSIRETLTQSTDKLAVDGVMLVAEHGTYAKSGTEQTIYPKRRLFTEVADVFRHSGRSVPVFIDKHLADNWQDAKWIYDTARELKVPLMAGSSVPSTWRVPPTDVRRGAKLKQIVGLSYHTHDAYGFHGLEGLQALAERRAGGETGVRRVQCLTGDAVWDTLENGVCDKAVFEAAIESISSKRWLKLKKTIREATKSPSVFVIDYSDGLRVLMFTLNGAIEEWTAAWRESDNDAIEAVRFEVQEERPHAHFTIQTMGIERMMQTGRPTWPVERTLLTSGILEAALISKHRSDEPLDTPYLDVKYTSDWNWVPPRK